jgi:hypothetical protein
MNGIYHGLTEAERTVILPDIKKGKTLYWIWADEIMPVTYTGVCYGTVTDDGKFHVTCEMRTKKRHEFPGVRRGKPIVTICDKGDRRIFYADDIGETVFFTREEAEAALRAGKETEAAQ